MSINLNSAIHYKSSYLLGGGFWFKTTGQEIGLKTWNSQLSRAAHIKRKKKKNLPLLSHALQMFRQVSRYPTIRIMLAGRMAVQHWVHTVEHYRISWNKSLSIWSHGLNYTIPSPKYPPSPIKYKQAPGIAFFFFILTNVFENFFFCISLIRFDDFPVKCETLPRILNKLS